MKRCLATCESIRIMKNQFCLNLYWRDIDASMKKRLSNNTVRIRSEQIWSSLLEFGSKDPAVGHLWQTLRKRLNSSWSAEIYRISRTVPQCKNGCNSAKIFTLFVVLISQAFQVFSRQHIGASLPALLWALCILFLVFAWTLHPTWRGDSGRRAPGFASCWIQT
jgi:hypothetical protein